MGVGRGRKKWVMFACSGISSVALLARGGCRHLGGWPEMVGPTGSYIESSPRGSECAVQYKLNVVVTLCRVIPHSIYVPLGSYITPGTLQWVRILD